MSASFDSIYPDFLRTGLGRVQSLGLSGDLLALFAALDHFRRDLHEHEEILGILHVAHRYITGLDLCRASAFYLVKPDDFGFELALCAPETERSRIDSLVHKEIKSGKFAWALRQSSPVVFDGGSKAAPERGLFHSLGVATRTIGMYCGLLHHEPAPSQEIAYSLLSVLLGISSDTLAAVRKTAALTTEINALSGLLPICAWCRKVRDDQGYWKQLESYVESRTEAVFSHGMCPDCMKKVSESTPATAK